jgi:cysteine dioxygenase
MASTQQVVNTKCRSPSEDSLDEKQEAALEATSDDSSSEPPAKKQRGGDNHHFHPDGRRKLCSLGTGEVVHLIALNAKDEESIDEFEHVVQGLSRDLYQMESGITDVRVCHPECGKVVFIITFLSRTDCWNFQRGPEQKLRKAMSKLISKSGGEMGVPEFECTGCLMPQTHTLASVLSYLKDNIRGYDHSDHDVKGVATELQRWYPRPDEYMKYVNWDLKDPKKYTRNLILGNEYFDCLLMCWPPHCQSSIHCHDRSSCWVVLVEGEVVEVQYAMPKMDKKFIEKQLKDPTGAVGRCGPLRPLNETVLRADGMTVAYANNEIGVHRVENRTDKPAYTMHIYAPGLRKIKIFKDGGGVCIHTLPQGDGCKSGSLDLPDGVLDVNGWNNPDGEEQ